jgi:surfactin synthase thioesterase subunit
MTDPSLPDNDAFELAQRIAEECSVDHSWFHFTKCATLIEQFVAERLAAMEARGTTEEAISALTARVAELEGERERLREACEAALPIVRADFSARHMLDGFGGYKRQPQDGLHEQLLAALAPPQPQPSKEGK